VKQDGVGVMNKMPDHNLQCAALTQGTGLLTLFMKTNNNTLAKGTARHTYQYCIWKVSPILASVLEKYCQYYW